MTTIHEIQTSKFLAVVNSHTQLHGSNLSQKVEENAELVLQWLNYLHISEATSVATILLQGVQSAVIETAGCLALGIARSALMALRAQVDMILSWLYFKDHSIEWSHVNNTGEGFMLKSELIKYLSEYIPRFSQRFGLLRQVMTRREVDPYKILSAHLHSQASAQVPTILSLTGLIHPLQACEDIVNIQREVDEYINDIVLSCFAMKWASLPKPIVDNAKSRLTDAQLQIFFD